MASYPCFRAALLMILTGISGLSLRAERPDPRADTLAWQLAAATSPEARARLLNELAWLYTEYDLDSARTFAWEAWEIGLRLNLNSVQAQAFKALGMADYHARQYGDAECQYLQAKSLFEAEQDTAGRLAILNNLGILYRIQGSCEPASRGYLEGMRLARAQGARQKESILWYNYFITQIACQAYESAFNTGDSLLAFSRLTGNDHLAAHTLAQLGYLHYKQEQDSMALLRLTESLRIAEPSGNPELLSTVYNNLGNVYEGLEEYQQAYEYYRLSLEMDQQQAYPAAIHNSYHNIGLALYHLKRYGEAIPYLEQSLSANAGEGNRSFLPDNYYSLGKAYAETGRHREAAACLLRSIELRDSLFNADMQRTIEELKQQYQTEKVARELAGTRLELERQQTRSARRMAWVSGGMAAVIGAAGIGLMALGRRRAELDKRRIELEYQVLRAQMNPHFIFNALNSIQGFFSEQDFAQGNEYLGAFGQLMRRVLDQSSQHAISLAEELDTLNLYLRLEQARLKDKFHFEVDLQEELDESMIFLPPLILQPFVENAIWHGIAPKEGPGLIRIRCSMPEDRDDLLHVEIADNGIGLRAAALHARKAHTSRGVSIIRERLGPQGSIRTEEVTDESGVARGTRVLLQIPLSHD
ncbi:MAG: tetratricopeptide repeat protein [Bacteroidia bacterium]|nr:tetratricopeptide repeat protein [Bacteroidia bacterium]